MSRHALTLHPLRRLGPPIVVLIILAALCVALTAPLASAATVQEALLTMTSDEGDWVGAGQTYSYATSTGDTFGSSTTTAAAVSANVHADNGDWWNLDFAAPQGQTLAVGTYDNAIRAGFPDRGAAPGLDVGGNGRGCNTLTGSFTVTQVTFGAAGTVETFDADFEQHCEGAEAALRGHLHLVNDPPPPPLQIGLRIEAGGSVDRAGVATVRGTITCNVPTTVYVYGVLTQRPNRFAHANSYYSVPVACSGTTSWNFEMSTTTDVPFRPGPAQLSVDALAFDPASDVQVRDSESATVRLAP